MIIDQALSQLLFKLQLKGCQIIYEEEIMILSHNHTVLIKKTKSVPLTNVALEQDFAVLDRLIS